VAAGVLVAGPVTGGAPAAAAVSCVKETTPPTITAFSFSPTAVDVRRGAKTVTITGAARDSGGVASMTAYFSSPRRADGKTSYASATLKLSKGTATNGTFSGRASVSRWGIPGSWTVQGVIATDRAGNSTYLSYADLKAKGWRRDLKVTSVADVTAPTLTSFTMSPVKVDTRTAAKRIKVTAKARDAQSGVLAIGVTLTRSKGARKTVTGGLVRSKGTVTNGIFTGYVTVPRWVGTAGWQASVSVFDAAFNTRSYSYAQLGAKRWTRTASVISGTDASLPVVTAEKFAPTTVDVRSAAKVVMATATAKDTGSGVAQVAVTWTSPSKRQSVTASLARRSGTALAGSWSGKPRSRCAPSRASGPPA
jgi:hypothetical protein